MWGHGAKESLYSAQWDSLYGMQMYSYVDPDVAWESFTGIMKLVNMSPDDPKTCLLYTSETNHETTEYEFGNTIGFEQKQEYCLENNNLKVTVSANGTVNLFHKEMCIRDRMNPASLIPKEFTLKNYVTVFTEFPFTQYLINTLFITITSTIGITLTSALVAYAFSRFDFKYKGIIFAVMLSTIMIPGQILQIPLYEMYRGMGWINTCLLYTSRCV